MTTERRLRHALVALLFALLSFAAPARCAAQRGCAGGGRPRPDEGGIGGTGISSMRPDDGGIGGTGFRPSRPDDEGGIGGTGVSADADTGVIGTVTGFASICVGGVEIHYGTDTPIRIDGQAAAAAQLAVGQVVEAVASGSGTELQAQQISVRHVVSGPVTRVDALHNEIDVVGQTVSLSPLTRAADGESAAVATAFPLQSYVQISGMRREDGIVVASRASRIEPRELAHVVGPVTNLDAGMLWIAGTAVRLETPVSVAIGDEVHVAGHWDGTALAANSVVAMPRVPFDGHVARVEIEGFARATAGGQLQVGAFAVEVSPATAQDVQRLSGLDTRIRVQAVVQNRHVIVERIGVMDELPSLPPLLPRDAPASSGGRVGEGRSAGAAPPPDPSRPGEGGGPPPHDDWGAKAEGAGAPEPMWNDRPPVPQPGDHSSMPPMPNRPSLPEPPDRPALPQIPDRPPIPQPPDRPSLPRPPDRPPRPDRPPLPVRPEIPHRP